MIRIPAPTLRYDRYASILANAFMLRPRTGSWRTAAMVKAAQLDAYARTEEILSNALAGRGVAREVANDFAYRFCARVLESLRAVKTESIQSDFR